MRRLMRWLNDKVVASGDEGEYYGYWDQVVDHEKVCACPVKGRQVGDLVARCERHAGMYIDPAKCAFHAHTYPQEGP